MLAWLFLVERLGVAEALGQQLVERLGQHETERAGDERHNGEDDKRYVDGAERGAEHVNLWRPDAAEARQCDAEADASAAQRCRIQLGGEYHAGELGGADGVLGHEVEGDRDGRSTLVVHGYEIDGHRAEVHEGDERQLAAVAVEHHVARDDAHELAHGRDREDQVGIDELVQVAADAHADAQVDGEYDHPGEEEYEAALEHHGRLEYARHGLLVAARLTQARELVGLVAQQREHVVPRFVVLHVELDAVAAAHRALDDRCGGRLASLHRRLDHLVGVAFCDVNVSATTPQEHALACAAQSTHQLHVGLVHASDLLDEATRLVHSVAAQQPARRLRHHPIVHEESV